MQLMLVCAEVEDLAHLRFRFAARSGIGHGHAGGKAVRGKKEVARRVAETGVKIEREGGVALNQRFGRDRRGARHHSDAE